MSTKIYDENGEYQGFIDFTDEVVQAKNLTAKELHDIHKSIPFYTKEALRNGDDKTFVQFDENLIPVDIGSESGYGVTIWEPSSVIKKLLDNKAAEKDSISINTDSDSVRFPKAEIDGYGLPRWFPILPVIQCLSDYPIKKDSSGS